MLIILKVLTSSSHNLIRVPGHTSSTSVGTGTLRRQFKNFIVVTKIREIFVLEYIRNVIMLRYP